MSTTMLVLSLEATRQILAAAVTVAAPEKTPEVADLTRDEFLVRHKEGSVNVPASRLKVAAIDVDYGVLLNPAGFCLDDQGKLKSVSAGTPAVSADPTALTIKLGNTNADALVFVSSHPNGPAGPFKISLVNGEGNIPLSTPAGSTFFCAVSVAGYQTFSKTVPVT